MMLINHINEVSQEKNENDQQLLRLIELGSSVASRPYWQKQPCDDMVILIVAPSGGELVTYSDIKIRRTPKCIGYRSKQVRHILFFNMSRPRNV